MQKKILHRKILISILLCFVFVIQLLPELTYATIIYNNGYIQFFDDFDDETNTRVTYNGSQYYTDTSGNRTWRFIGNTITMTADKKLSLSVTNTTSPARIESPAVTPNQTSNIISTTVMFDPDSTMQRFYFEHARTVGTSVNYQFSNDIVNKKGKWQILFNYGTVSDSGFTTSNYMEPGKEYKIRIVTRELGIQSDSTYRMTCQIYVTDELNTTVNAFTTTQTFNKSTGLPSGIVRINALVDGSTKETVYFDDFSLTSADVLTNLTVNGATIANFSPDTLNYTLQACKEGSPRPVITGTSIDPGLQPVINTSDPVKTVITVGSKSYTVNFNFVNEEGIRIAGLDAVGVPSSGTKQYQYTTSVFNTQEQLMPDETAQIVPVGTLPQGVSFSNGNLSVSSDAENDSTVTLRAVWDKDQTVYAEKTIRIVNITDIVIIGPDKRTIIPGRNNSVTYTARVMSGNNVIPGATVEWSVYHNENPGVIDLDPISGVLTVKDTSDVRKIGIKAISTVVPDVFRTKEISIEQQVLTTIDITGNDSFVIPGTGEADETAQYTIQTKDQLGEDMNMSAESPNWQIAGANSYLQVNGNGIVTVKNGCLPKQVELSVQYASKPDTLGKKNISLIKVPRPVGITISGVDSVTIPSRNQSNAEVQYSAVVKDQYGAAITTDLKWELLSEPFKTRIDDNGKLWVMNGEKEARITVKASTVVDPLVNTTKNIKLENPPVSSEQSGGSGGGGSGSKSSVTINSIPVTSPMPLPTPVNTSAVNFDDIETVAWAKNAIVDLANKGLIKGREDKKFAPEDNITRAEFVTLLVNAFAIDSQDTETNFTDVKSGEWYAKAVASAEKFGLVSGRPGNSFGVNDSVTRQDMAVIIHRLVGKKNIELPNASDAEQFDDYQAIEQYAVDSVEAMQKAGIVKGIGNQFAPNQSLTRAQAATIIHRLIEMMK